MSIHGVYDGFIIIIFYFHVTDCQDRKRASLRPSVQRVIWWIQNLSVGHRRRRMMKISDKTEKRTQTVLEKTRLQNYYVVTEHNFEM